MWIICRCEHLDEPDSDIVRIELEWLDVRFAPLSGIALYAAEEEKLERMSNWAEGLSQQRKKGRAFALPFFSELF
ncbi:MAG: hypothetical protein ABF370_16575 [Verrucomicrobiales bacterium]